MSFSAGPSGATTRRSSRCGRPRHRVGGARRRRQLERAMDGCELLSRRPPRARVPRLDGARACCWPRTCAPRAGVRFGVARGEGMVAGLLERHADRPALPGRRRPGRARSSHEVISTALCASSRTSWPQYRGGRGARPRPCASLRARPAVCSSRLGLVLLVVLEADDADLPPQRPVAPERGELLAAGGPVVARAAILATAAVAAPATAARAAVLARRLRDGLDLADGGRGEPHPRLEDGIAGLQPLRALAAHGGPLHRLPVLTARRRERLAHGLGPPTRSTAATSEPAPARSAAPR